MCIDVCMCIKLCEYVCSVFELFSSCGGSSVAPVNCIPLLHAPWYWSHWTRGSTSVDGGNLLKSLQNSHQRCSDRWATVMFSDQEDWCTVWMLPGCKGCKCAALTDWKRNKEKFYYNKLFIYQLHKSQDDVRRLILLLYCNDENKYYSKEWCISIIKKVRNYSKQ